MQSMSEDEIAMLRATTRRFVRDRLVPLEAQVEAADDIEPALLAQLRQEAVALGLYGFNLPESLGGPGLPADAKPGPVSRTSSRSEPFEPNTWKLKPGPVAVMVPR